MPLTIIYSCIATSVIVAIVVWNISCRIGRNENRFTAISEVEFKKKLGNAYGELFYIIHHEYVLMNPWTGYIYLLLWRTPTDMNWRIKNGGNSFRYDCKKAELVFVALERCDESIPKHPGVYTRIYVEDGKIKFEETSTKLKIA